MKKQTVEYVREVAEALNGQSVYIEDVLGKVYVGHLQVKGNTLVVGHKEKEVDVTIVATIRRV